MRSAQPQHIALLIICELLGRPAITKSARQMSPHLWLRVRSDFSNAHWNCCASAENAALQASTNDGSPAATVSRSGIHGGISSNSAIAYLSSGQPILPLRAAPLWR